MKGSLMITFHLLREVKDFLQIPVTLYQAFFFSTQFFLDSMSTDSPQQNKTMTALGKRVLGAWNPPRNHSPVEQRFLRVKVLVFFLSLSFIRFSISKSILARPSTELQKGQIRIKRINIQVTREWGIMWDLTSIFTELIFE